MPRGAYGTRGRYAGGMRTEGAYGDGGREQREFERSVDDTGDNRPRAGRPGRRGMMSSASTWSSSVNTVIGALSNGRSDDDARRPSGGSEYYGFGGRAGWGGHGW